MMKTVASPRAWLGPHLLPVLLFLGPLVPTQAFAQDAENPVLLDEIVVTASGFEQNLSQAPASITLVNQEQLLQNRGNDLAEVLMNIEGIDIGGNRGKTGGLNISMRGMPSDYTLILIDGRRQNAAGNVTPNGFGETSSSFLPPISSIERIEVIRGPMATLYGSDGMGGVINIITKKVGESWHGSLTSDATLQETEGWGNTFSGNFALTGPIVQGRLGLNLQGSLLRRQSSALTPTGEVGESTTISQRGPSPTQGDIRSIGGRLNFTPAPSHVLALEFDVARQAYDNTNGELGTLDSPTRIGGYSPELRFNRDRYTLSHAWTLDRAHVDLSLMHNTTVTEGRTLPEGTPGGPPGSGIPDKTPGSPRDLSSTNTVLDGKIVSSLGHHTLSLGGQYWDGTMVDGVALIPFEQQTWSVFAENEWRLLPTLGFTAGLRYDTHSAFGSHLSPRGYVVWNVTPSWTLKGGVSGGYKTPRLEQLQEGIIGFTGQGTIASIGTPDLKPETSRTTEVALHYTGASGWSGNISLFQNQFDDKITTGTPIPNCTFSGAPDLPGCLNFGDFPNQETFRQQQNVDRAMTRGGEFSLRIPFTPSWALTTNYTYTESEQQSGPNEGWPLTNTPKHMVNGNLQGTPLTGLNVWMRGEYRSGRARRTSASTNLAWEALGDYKPYELLHLGGGYEISSRVTINATVYNLLNKDFLTYASYQGNPSSSNPSGVQYTSLYNNHQEGRRLWLSTTFQF